MRVTAPFAKDRQGNLWMGAVDPVIARKQDPGIERIFWNSGLPRVLATMP